MGPLATICICAMDLNFLVSVYQACIHSKVLQFQPELHPEEGYSVLAEMSTFDEDSDKHFGLEF